MSHTIYSHRHENGTFWCIKQKPAGVTDPMVVIFRCWNGMLLLLNRSARWTGDGWDTTRWTPKPPIVPQGILDLVEQHMRQQP